MGFTSRDPHRYPVWQEKLGSTCRHAFANDYLNEVLKVRYLFTNTWETTCCQP